MFQIYYLRVWAVVTGSSFTNFWFSITISVWVTVRVYILLCFHSEISERICSVNSALCLWTSKNNVVLSEISVPHVVEVNGESRPIHFGVWRGFPHAFSFSFHICWGTFFWGLALNLLWHFYLLFNVIQDESCLSSGCHNKYHRLGGLNNRNLFLIVLKAGRSKIEVEFWCRLSPWLANGHFLAVSSHGAERAQILWCLFLKDMNPFPRAPSTSSKPSYPQSVHLQIPSHCSLDCNIWMFCRTRFIHTTLWGRGRASDWYSLCLLWDLSQLPPLPPPSSVLEVRGCCP